MRYMEKLLEGVKVEWEPISKILIRTKGTKITAEQMKKMHNIQAPLKIFAGGKTVAFVNFEDIPEKDINREPSIIVKSRGIIEFEYYDKPFSHKNEMWSYHSKNEYLDIKFIYYFLKINEPYFQNIGNRMQMPQISTPDTEKFKIPIPCPDNPKKSLKIQQEIVRILDTFTRLIAELTAELTARKKQYAYYREQLLTFKEGEVEWKRLGEVANLKRGETITAKNKTEGNIPVISGGQKPAYYTAEYNREGETITISGSGAYAGYVSYWNEPIFVSGAFSVKPNLSILSVRYVFHFLLKHQGWIYNLKRGAGVPHVYPKDLANFLTPIPPLRVQQEIVRILDKFDTLTTSISEGLPREIELRKKQYAYYREQLLTFRGKKEMNK